MEKGCLGFTNQNFTKRNNSLSREENDASFIQSSVYAANDSIKGMGMLFVLTGLHTFAICKIAARAKCLFDLKSHLYGFYYLEQDCFHWTGPTGTCAELFLAALEYDKENKDSNPIYYTRWISVYLFYVKY
jgi:hypothetical protein